MHRMPRRLRRLSAVLAIGALVPLTVALPSSATAPAAAPVVDARQGKLTNRPTDMPTTDAKQRQLSRGTVTQDLVKKRVRATVVLRAVPTAATDAMLDIEFGRLSGGTCVGDFHLTTRTYTDLSAGFTRNGATIKLNKAASEAAYEDWNCAFAVVTANASATPYDVLIGQLSNINAKPKLKVTQVRLLRKKVSTVGLVPGVWTTLNVRIANSGRVDAKGTRLTGSGRGLKVKAAKVGKVYNGSNSVARIKVKLTGKKRTKLKLVARSGKVSAKRVVKVKRVAAPKRPVNGRYKSKNGRTSFRIKNGRVVGFHSRQWTRCGGYPDLPTYNWATYDFPRTRIARNGIVDARQKGKLFTAGLELKISGKKIRQGYFYYSGPNRCFASEVLKIRRVGK